MNKIETATKLIFASLLGFSFLMFIENELEKVNKTNKEKIDLYHAISYGKDSVNNVCYATVYTTNDIDTVKYINIFYLPCELIDKKLK